MLPEVELRLKFLDGIVPRVDFGHSRRCEQPCSQGVASNMSAASAQILVKTAGAEEIEIARVRVRVRCGMYQAAGGLLQVLLASGPCTRPSIFKARNAVLIVRDEAAVSPHGSEHTFMQDEEQHDHSHGQKKKSNLCGVIFRKPDAKDDDDQANDELGGDVKWVTLFHSPLYLLKLTQPAAVFLFGYH